MKAYEELAAKELMGLFPFEELESRLESFVKIKHMLGPFGFFVPMMDEEFTSLSAQERDNKDPGKLGPKTKKRLSFLLKEYDNALPIIDFFNKKALEAQKE